jgi:hypothetical protein
MNLELCCCHCQSNSYLYCKMEINKGDHNEWLETNHRRNISKSPTVLTSTPQSENMVFGSSVILACLRSSWTISFGRLSFFFLSCIFWDDVGYPKQLIINCRSRCYVIVHLLVIIENSTPCIVQNTCTILTVTSLY